MKLEQAIRIATMAFDEQKDSFGMPKVLHSIEVMMECYHDKMNEKYLVCSVLHDVVEDTDYTLHDLQQLGCTNEQLMIIDLLTRKHTDTYFDYIRKIKENVIATQIKLNDIAHNLTRCSYSLVKRYIKAQDILTQ